MRADYVVVGAGSAGCVVASRLSETGASVILLEAGPSDWHPMIHIPAGMRSLIRNPLVNWNYTTEPEKGTGERRMEWPRGARHGRLELDQRHALCARRAGRFRRLGADGLPRLELRRRAALLQEVRALRAGRRCRGARPGRAAQGRGLPHHPAAHPSLRRSRATGGLPVQSRSQRQAAPGRRLFADDAARPPARLDGADFSARGQGSAQPARRDRGAGRQAAVRGQALRRCHLPARRQPHRGARQPRGDRVGRHHQLAAHPADLGHRPGRSTCSRWASPWCTTWPESAPTSSTTT